MAARLRNVRCSHLKRVDCQDKVRVGVRRIQLEHVLGPVERLGDEIFIHRINQEHMPRPRIGLVELDGAEKVIQPVGTELRRLGLRRTLPPNAIHLREFFVERGIFGFELKSLLEIDLGIRVSLHISGGTCSCQNGLR